MFSADSLTHLTVLLKQAIQVQISNISSFCVVHSLHLLMQPKKQTATNEWSLAGSQPVGERAVPSSLKAGLVILQEVQLLHNAGPMKAEERYRSGSGGGWPVVEVRQSCWKGRGELEGFLGPLRADEEGSGGRQPPLLSLSLSLPLYSLLPQGFRVCIVVLLMRTVGAEHSGWRSEKQLTLGMCSHSKHTS